MPAERTTAIRAIRYNEKGQRERIEYGNGSTTTYEYDPETFRLLRLRTTKDGGAVLQDLQYAYDPTGNITGIRDDAQQTVYFGNTIVEPHAFYEYDALYRLTRAEGREHAAQNNVQRDNARYIPELNIPFPNSPEALQRYVEEYRYDCVGNILSMGHSGGEHLRWKRCYQYAQDSNRLLATGRPGDLTRVDAECPAHYVRAPTLSQRYAYDTHGSMLNLANVAPAQFLRWDYRDMIHSLDLVGGGWAYYNYDASKQRTRKRIEHEGDLTEERLYLGGLEVYRRWRGDDPVEEIETHHLFVEDQRVLLVEDVLATEGPELSVDTLYRYQYGNNLGSVGLELDKEGSAISYEEFHPYGTTAYEAKNTEIAAKAKRYRHTGMERDEESGLWIPHSQMLCTMVDSLGRCGSSRYIRWTESVFVFTIKSSYIC